MDKTFEDNKSNVRDAMETIPLESWRREAMTQEKKAHQSQIVADELQEQQEELVHIINIINQLKTSKRF